MGVYSCPNHKSIPNIWTCEGQLTAIIYSLNDYHLILDYRVNRTVLTKMVVNPKDGNYYRLLDLEYLVDITPDNFESWLQRIINLQAFL